MRIDMVEMLPDDVVQYGVKGMKWGVRKASSANQRVARAQLNSPAAKLGKAAGTKIAQRREAKSAEKRTASSAKKPKKGGIFAPSTPAQRKAVRRKARNAGKTYLNDPAVQYELGSMLRKRGFNALLDDNDRGIVSRQPLILLNPDGSVKRMKTQPLSADDINRAKANIKPPTETS